MPSEEKPGMGPKKIKMTVVGNDRRWCFVFYREDSNYIWNKLLNVDVSLQVPITV